jgi:hypothetical protein
LERAGCGFAPIVPAAMMAAPCDHKLLLFEMDGLCLRCCRCGARWLAIREDAAIPDGLVDYERSTGRQIALAEGVVNDEARVLC